jgi:nucleoside-diphosphate-sugar epimerase
MRVLTQKNWKTNRLKKYKLAIVGFGDVGQRLGALLSKRATVLGVGRQAPPNRMCTFLLADLDQKSTLKRLAALPSRVIYLAPPPQIGVDDPRMKRFLAATPQVKDCIYVSTTGVYGPAGGAWVDEITPLRPNEARGERRVAAENRLKASQIQRVSVLRAPGIYAQERLPIARIQAGLPAFLPSEDVPTNHIHADDLARLCWLGLFKARNRRSYNAADGQPMMHGDYLQAVAQRYGLPAPERLPSAQVKAALSPMAWSMLAGARRVSSVRLLTEWGVRLKYPDMTAFLAHSEPNDTF